MIFHDTVFSVVRAVICCMCIHSVCSKSLSSADTASEKQILDLKTGALKKGILEGLNYLNPPDVTKFNMSISEKRQRIREFRDYMRKKQDMRFIAEDDESEPGDDSQVYTYVSTDDIPNKVKPRSGTPKMIFFHLNEAHPEDPHEELKVKSARLKVHIKIQSAITKTVKNKSSDQMEISVHHIGNVNSNGLVEKRLIQSKYVNIKQNGWEEFDVTQTVQEWIDNKDKNFGLELTSSTHNISKVFKSVALDNRDVLNISVDTVLEFKARVQPILKRVKRQAARRDCSRGDGESRCCRFSSYISFKEIGWDDWILAPPGYEAHYCDGSCPHGFKIANTFASIQSILHQKNPSIPAPCCVPTQLSPLTILHFDEHGQYTFTDYPDMIVEECRCA